MDATEPAYIIYTDGGCAYNPGGPGGCAAVLINTDTGEISEYSAGYKATTNNRMEIMAVILALLHEENSPDKKGQPVLQQQELQPVGMDHAESNSAELKEMLPKNPVKRKNLPQSTRITIYNKAEGRCAICGDFVPYDEFTIDHIEPLSKGGDNEMDNLQCTCRFCNFLKGNLPDQEFMDKVTDIVLVRAGKDKEFRKKLRKKFKKLP